MRMSKLFKAHLIRELILFALLVIILSLFFSLTLQSHLIEEFTNRGTAISNSLANSSVELLLNRDASTIQARIDQFLDSSSGVAYLFVVDEQHEVIAHTFVPHIPAEVPSASGRVGEGAKRRNGKETRLLALSPTRGRRRCRNCRSERPTHP